MNKNQYFNTPDTVLAATICYHGYIIDHLENDTGSVFFCWKNDREIEKLLSKYNDGKIKVEPRRWHNHYKQVLSRMRNYQNVYGNVIQ